jgi:ABC-type transporter Mla MlaB component
VIFVHPLGLSGVVCMLRITTVKKRRKVTLGVEGRLAGPSVGTLEQCWRELRAASTNEKFSVNLCGVSFIDAAGKVLLKEIHRQGGQLVAEGCLNQAIVREIVGKESGRDRGANGGRGKGSHIIFYLAFFSLLATSRVSRAQGTPKPSALPANPPGQVLRLTLDQAVALAPANDNQIAAPYRFNQARADLARAIGQME